MVNKTIKHKINTKQIFESSKIHYSNLVDLILSTKY